MEALINRRSVIKGLLTRADKFANTLSADSSEEEVNERAKRAKELIEALTTVEDEMFALDPAQASESEVVEEQYYRIIANLNTWLRKKSICTAELKFNESIANNTVNSSGSDVKLPRLNIPSFAGDYRDWHSFIDLFDITVHKNSNLSPAQKLQYLKGLLKDDASSLLRHFSITEANYIEAYQKLCKRYDRKSVTANAFIKLFMDQPTIHQANSNNIRRLLDTSDEATRGLKALGTQADSKDVWLIYLLVNKLDDESRQLWKRSKVDEELPSLQSLYEFLAHRADELDEIKPFTKGHSSKSGTEVKTLHITTENTCPVCRSNDHQLYECTKFKSLDIIARRDLIKNEARCFNCLNTSHGVYNCRTRKRCRICNRKHHSLLHIEEQYGQPSNETPEVSRKLETEYPSSASSQKETFDNNITKNFNVSVYQAPCSSGYTLLPTALIKIKDSMGEWQLCRALLDSGSQASFATENLIQRLQIPRANARITISGLGQIKALTSRGKANFSISSRLNRTTINKDCLIVPKLTSDQPFTVIERDRWRHVEHLPLADPNFNQPNQIDLLIGSDQFFRLLNSGKITGGDTGLVAQSTIFGWIVAGPFYKDYQKPKAAIGLHCEMDIDNSLRKFWELEEVTSSSQLTKYTEEEMECEDHFEKNTTRSDKGRFIVRLPFKSAPTNLSNTLNGAIKRLQAVERRFEREPTFKHAYHSFMEEYLSLNHMEVIPPAGNHYPEGVFYLPHHGVVRDSSTTTKLRVVFDASFNPSNGTSLNDTLLVGPTVYEPLTSILIRFRTYKFVFTADIEKMFRQILLHPDDRNYHRKVWRSDPTKQPTHYRMCTVTYGTASAPYLATKTLQVIGNSVLESNPIAAKKILHDFYVDDFMSGSHNLEDARKVSQDVLTLLKSYGFHLRKWSSNHPEILKDIPTEDKEQLPINITEDAHVNLKLLGVQWNPILDSFQFKVTTMQQSRGSKREVLSQSARIFDPLGWLSSNITQMRDNHIISQIFT